MTLVTRSKPPAHHKKVSGHHHNRNKSYYKPYWPYLPLLLVVGLGLLLNTAWPFGKASVLGYATDMSISSLLTDTNQQRSANGVKILTLNSKLDSAAQAKANDMAAKDYWSHDTPDGKTPWTFITAAGYDYQTAGENLAYGFATAADTITGWMNSPEHRANMLSSSFRDVGFGFVNIADYQGDGPETLVVAMYASPQSVATTPVSKPVSSTPTTVKQSTASSTSQAAGGGSTKSSAKHHPAPKAAPAKNDTLTPTPTSSAKPAETPPKDISRVQLLTAGRASWSMFAVSLTATAALLFFLLRHGLAWHKVLRRGERFVLKHRLLDIIIVGVAVLGFVLTRASGVIR